MGPESSRVLAGGVVYLVGILVKIVVDPPPTPGPPVALLIIPGHHYHQALIRNGRLRSAKGTDSDPSVHPDEGSKEESARSGGGGGGPETSGERQSACAVATGFKAGSRGHGRDVIVDSSTILPLFSHGNRLVAVCLWTIDEIAACAYVTLQTCEL
ncbi:hypothetical protein GEV33_007775 [Tenebrio molitor]|uniref:Uncharacterized protein n=1 Tax=Tenebrio molitor TaxID=7067 RepID=A0A8J6LII6_TENMO|nr:hypothetical protein GEV33_007775 [Tenebrio molitor]